MEVSWVGAGALSGKKIKMATKYIKLFIFFLSKNFQPYGSVSASILDGWLSEGLREWRKKKISFPKKCPQKMKFIRCLAGGGSSGIAFAKTRSALTKHFTPHFVLRL